MRNWDHDFCSSTIKWENKSKTQFILYDYMWLHHCEVVFMILKFYFRLLQHTHAYSEAHLSQLSLQIPMTPRKYLHCSFVLSEKFGGKLTQNIKKCQIQRWVALTLWIRLLKGKFYAIPKKTLKTKKCKAKTVEKALRIGCYQHWTLFPYFKKATIQSAPKLELGDIKLTSVVLMWFVLN